jgi:hypothetical protein
MNIGCPNCDDAVVEVVGGVSASDASGGSSNGQAESDGGDLGPAFRDPNRLTGTTVDCSNCGDEFEVYFY